MTGEERWAAEWRYWASGKTKPDWRSEKERKQREERIPVVVFKQGRQTVGVVAGKRKPS